MIEPINLAEKFSRFIEHWSPKIVGEINDTHVKLVKVKGEFVWHHHDIEDELFLVIAGSLIIRLRDGEIHLEAGECAIIPHGVEHQPFAREEVQLVLLEPKSTVNTGTAGGDQTVAQSEWI